MKDDYAYTGKTPVVDGQTVQVDTTSIFDPGVDPVWENAIVESALATQFTATTLGGWQLFRNYRDKGVTWRDMP
jgi:hypothetical protein